MKPLIGSMWGLNNEIEPLTERKEEMTFQNLSCEKEAVKFNIHHFFLIEVTSVLHPRDPQMSESLIQKSTIMVLSNGQSYWSLTILNNKTRGISLL